jgi:16S rRNA (guanine527-N7)-methyltransferase
MWFAARCADLSIPDAAAHRSQLEAIYGHLVGVNRWFNLTRITAPRDYLKTHVLDSLVVTTDPRLRHASEGDWCADLGSGGGYPGLPLAIWFPRLRWALIDARRRKADFLQAAGTLTGAMVRGVHLRGADVAVQAAGADLHHRCHIVTSRAMAQAAEVLREAAPLLQRHGHCLIFKGPAFDGEERAAAKAACPKLGFRFVSERRVALEAGDPERVVVVYERTG